MSDQRARPATRLNPGKPNLTSLTFTEAAEQNVRRSQRLNTNTPDFTSPTLKDVAEKTERTSLKRPCPKREAGDQKIDTEHIHEPVLKKKKDYKGKGIARPDPPSRSEGQAKLPRWNLVDSATECRVCAAKFNHPMDLKLCRWLAWRMCEDCWTTYGTQKGFKRLGGHEKWYEKVSLRKKQLNDAEQLDGAENAAGAALQSPTSNNDEMFPALQTSPLFPFFNPVLNPYTQQPLPHGYRPSVGYTREERNHLRKDSVWAFENDASINVFGIHPGQQANNAPAPEEAKAGSQVTEDWLQNPTDISDMMIDHKGEGQDPGPMPTHILDPNMPSMYWKAGDF
ncbi:hypothetical protein EDB81DRAFT_885432 [Dactylonectria macrodidyma]|uniref:Uncharacterized protein n=1 Tax=Dactylonectria macrodidyma TaxID=307937 RepID=A0A9P9EP90_9HYPO|nr:hypothetical protein EDB81DRAFT_885432 [Dactylonectria macrodidyma]